MSADKINLVAVWREAPLFSTRERAALAWTEALTVLAGGVSDEVYAEASAEFSEKELLYLTSAIASINAWNRYGAGLSLDPAGAAEERASRRFLSQLGACTQKSDQTQADCPAPMLTSGHGQFAPACPISGNYGHATRAGL